MVGARGFAAALVGTAAVCPVAWGQVFARPLDDAGIRMDGQTEEWPPAVYLGGDAEHVYLRFKSRQPITLLAAPAPVTLKFDLDGNEHSGRTIGGLGVDLEIRFSETPPPGSRGPSIGVTAIEANGTRRELSAERIGLVTAPSHASEWFELRFDRGGELGELIAGSLADGGAVAAQVVAGGGNAEQPDANVIPGVLPKRGSGSKADAVLPTVPEGGVRVASWNVLWDGPVERPESYGRVISALAPDVLLLQEWTRAVPDESAIAAWLDEHAAHPAGAWNVEASEGWGVIVASPYPFAARGSQKLTTGGVGNDYPIRFAAAAIKTPAGVGVFGTLHHKCCGGLGTDEDVRRLAEAVVLNTAMAELVEQTGAEMVVIGGDYNLVGSLGVLTVGTAELDLDGTGLRVAEPTNLADERVMYTFGRPEQADLRSRLDYVAYSDSTVRPANAFVLETGLLSASSLKAMGLRETDSYASDHLPVVVDLVPARR